MKKIKLLTPILTLSAIALPIATLTSCDKDQGKVTEIEWNNAFDYLANKNYKSAWKASEGDGVRALSQREDASGNTTTEYSIYRDINIKQDILNLNLLDFRDEPTGETLIYKNMQGLIRNNFSFEFTFEADAKEVQTEYSIRAVSRFQSLISEMFDEQYMRYKDFTYNNGSYYRQDTISSGTGGKIKIELSSKITFNNDKKIGFIDTFILMQPDVTSSNAASDYQLYEMILHPQYSNIDASISDEYEKWTHNHIDYLDKVASKTITLPDKYGFVVNIDNYAYQKISLIKDGTALSNPSIDIYKNGTLLKSGYSTDSGIKFDDPITAKDKISLLFKQEGLTTGNEVIVSLSS